MDTCNQTYKSLHEAAIAHGLPKPGDSSQLFWIPDVNLDALTRRIDWLNARAVKLNAEPIQLLLIGHFSYTRKNRTHNYTVVFVAGTRIRLAGGWTFAGTLEHTEAGNVLRSAPDEHIPARYKTVEPACDHCRLERRRKDTYIVRSAENEYQQVGRTCLKDFVGHRSPAAIAAWASYIAELSAYIEEEYAGTGKPTGLDAKYFLTLVAASIRLWGWTPRSKSDGFNSATADSALWWADQDYKALAKNHALLRDNGLPRVNNRGVPVETNQADADLADSALSWARDLSGDLVIENDYLWNLHIVAQGAGFTFRQVGLAASMISAFTRYKQQEAEKNARPTSDWVGTVKTRQQFTDLDLVAVFSFETMYGVTYLHKFYDLDGNIIVWKTGSVSLDQGCNYSGKATVKAHDTYKAEKQTIVTRAALVTED